MLKSRFQFAQIRIFLYAGLMCLCAFLAPSSGAFAQSTCIPVHGLSFERIDDLKLLASREGRNVAIINLKFTSSFLPARLGQFRFFSANLCGSGAEGQFHIDGKLYMVNFIQIFKQ
jgi:hypothetical protein